MELAIQPHGLLLAVRQSDDEVIWASQNAEALLGIAALDLLGMKLADVLTTDGSKHLETMLAASRPTWMPATPWSDPQPVRSIENDTEFAALIHRGEDVTVLELYPRREPVARSAVNTGLRNRIAYEMPQPQTIPDLAVYATEIFRDLTGYQFVLFYRWPNDRGDRTVAFLAPDGADLSDLWFSAPPPSEAGGESLVFEPSRVFAIADRHAQPVDVASRNTLSVNVTVDGHAPRKRLRAATFNLTLLWPSEDDVIFLDLVDARAALKVRFDTQEGPWGFIACFDPEPHRLSAIKLQLCDIIASVLPTYIERIETTALLTTVIEAERLAYNLEKISLPTSNLLTTSRGKRIA